MKHIALVSAGINSPSSTSKLCDHISATIRGMDSQCDVNLVELRELAHALPSAIVSGLKHPDLLRAISVVESADALVMATPIYKGSYSGLFKLFVDILDRDVVVGRPVLLAATGGSTRHSLAVDTDMRSLFAQLRAIVIPTTIFAAPEDWRDIARSESLSSRVNRASHELLLLIKADLHNSMMRAGSGKRSLGSAASTIAGLTVDKGLMDLAAGGSLET